MTKRWVQIPRSKEGPEPVYLAKVPDRPRKRGDVMVEQQQPMAAAAVVAAMVVRRRVPPPKRKAKPRGRKPGQKKTVSFAEERLRTFPVVVPHNSEVAGAAVELKEGDTEMVDVGGEDAVGEEEVVVSVEEVVVAVEEKREVEEVKVQKREELPKKPEVSAVGVERKAHPLPPRPAGLPPKPVGAANLITPNEE